MLTIIVIAFLLMGFAAVYVLFIRPLLKQWSALADFWATEISIWRKIRALFDGVKIKLLARLVWVPTLLVGAYDKFTVLCASCDLSPITSHLPATVQSLLPLASALVIPMLIDVARSYSSSPQSPGG